MQGIPSVNIERASYENIEVTCPHCGCESIFNRRSDLCTTERIVGRDVRCLYKECSKPFRVVGDLANERHEMLIYDCRELLERKHYTQCILNTTTAYETFFSLFFRVELAYKPFAAESTLRIGKLNELLLKLQAKTAKYTFHSMRALFLRHIVGQTSVEDLCKAEYIVESDLDQPNCPSNTEIEALGKDCGNLVEPLLKLNRTEIHRLRNQVAHRKAYRPTREEAVQSLQEAQSILIPLTLNLDLHDDPNWYKQMAHRNL